MRDVGEERGGRRKNGSEGAGKQEKGKGVLSLHSVSPVAREMHVWLLSVEASRDERRSLRLGHSHSEPSAILILYPMYAYSRFLSAPQFHDSLAKGAKARR